MFLMAEHGVSIVFTIVRHFITIILIYVIIFLIFLRK